MTDIKIDSVWVQKKKTPKEFEVVVISGDSLMVKENGEGFAIPWYISDFLENHEPKPVVDDTFNDDTPAQTFSTLFPVNDEREDQKSSLSIKIDSVWRDRKSGELFYIESLDDSISPINFNSLDNVSNYTESTEKFLSQYEFVCDSRFDSCLAFDVEAGKKDDSQKIRYSLLPVGTVNQLVKVLEFGSKKYADNNWQKVPNARTRYYDAAMRHIDWWWQGEKSDSETGLHHLAHAICCLMFLIWFDGDDK